jgi:hypothetical protein
MIDVVAQTNHIIYVWHSGEYQKEVLSVMQQTHSFRKYLNYLQGMSEEQTNTLEEICSTIYELSW